MKTIRFILLTLILLALCWTPVKAQQGEPYYGELAMIASEFHAQLREAAKTIANLQSDVARLKSENEKLKAECGKTCEPKKEDSK